MSQKRNPAPGATGNGAGFGVRDAAEFSAELAESQGYRGSVLRKNMAEEIRVGLSEFNGHDLVNLRVWADPRSGGTERIPTKAGIACNVRLLPELIEALQKAEGAARKVGLL